MYLAQPALEDSSSQQRPFAPSAGPRYGGSEARRTHRSERVSAYPDPDTPVWADTQVQKRRSRSRAQRPPTDDLQLQRLTPLRETNTGGDNGRSVLAGNANLIVNNDPLAVLVRPPNSAMEATGVAVTDERRRVRELVVLVDTAAWLWMLLLLCFISCFIIPHCYVRRIDGREERMD